MKALHLNILERLDQIINYTAAHIHDFISDPHTFTRKRRLSAATTIKTTINMQGNCLDTELRHAFGDEQVMSTSAYIQQKSKLSSACFHYILQSFNQSLPCRQLLDSKYRVFAIDGSDFNQLWNPESQNIVKFSSNQKKPYCQIHVNALYDLLNNTYQDCIFQPRAKMDERTAAVQMLKRLDVGPYIVIMDRGYSAFNLIENCNRLPNCYYLVRTKAGRSGIKEISALPDQEYDDDLACRVTSSNYYYTTHKDKEKLHLVMHYRHHYKKHFSKYTQDARWDFEDICKVKFRVCKVRINDADTGKPEWEVLLTNLDRNVFPLARIKKLYYLRWGIESSFRKLKYDLGSVQFHSKQDEFIKMEIYAHMIMFNAVSQIDAQAYVPQRECKYKYKINFKQSCDIVHWHYQQSSLAFSF